MDAIRYEVARSAERAYKSLAIRDMAQMFMLSSGEEVRVFIEQNNMKDGVGW